MKILLVEDDLNNADLMSQVLADAGYLVEHLANARDALFRAASVEFDLIILDRMLPGGIDGIRIVEALRSEDNLTPVLFLSGLASVADKVRGFNAGGSDYLVKPFAVAELLARVEALSRRPPKLRAVAVS
jgi:two-component system OmpR family response regulator